MGKILANKEKLSPNRHSLISTLPAVSETPTAKSVTTLDKARPQKTSKAPTLTRKNEFELVAPKNARISSKTGLWTMIRMMKTMVAALKPAWFQTQTKSSQWIHNEPQGFKGTPSGPASTCLGTCMFTATSGGLKAHHFILNQVSVLFPNTHFKAHPFQNPSAFCTWKFWLKTSKAEDIRGGSGQAGTSIHQTLLRWLFWSYPNKSMKALRTPSLKITSMTLWCFFFLFFGKNRKKRVAPPSLSSSSDLPLRIHPTWSTRIPGSHLSRDPSCVCSAGKGC